MCNSHITFGQEMVISLSVSRNDADHLTYRLSYGQNVSNLTKINFNCSISNDDARYDNIYAKDGNIVLHNRHKTTGGGQRVGFAPSLNQYVILSELTYAFSTDEWNPAR